MIADLAKVERIAEAGEANEGVCIQLVKEGVINRLANLIEQKNIVSKLGDGIITFILSVSIK